MTKVWRNSEGREYKATPGNDAYVNDRFASRYLMEALGYELVEKEPVSFEAVAALFSPGEPQVGEVTSPTSSLARPIG